MVTQHEQLKNNLSYLKLEEMNNHLDETIDFINSNNVSFTEGLIKLTNYQIELRERNMINAMVKVGNFPHTKELKDFDFSYQENINKEQILDLETLRFFDNKENIIFLGSSGVGKTHLATSIGITAAKNRISTYFIKCSDLILQLKRAQLENRLDSRLKHFTSYGVLIIDEIGYLPIDRQGANLFFQLISKRYGKKSTIITTNMPFSKWSDVFYDATLANAVLDRLLHYSNVIRITGNSYRIKDKIERAKDEADKNAKNIIILITI